MHAVGDGPAIINSSNIDESVKKSFAEKYGLNEPLYIQLLLFWKNFFIGNFGPSLSIHLGKEINEFIWPKFFRSLLIGGLAAILALILGIGIGLLMGLNKGKFLSKFSEVIISLFIAIPPFIIAIFFVVIASSSGFPIIYQQTNPITWVLPILAIAIPSSMQTAKFMKTRLFIAQETQYASLAKSKGLSPRRVIMRHLLKESLFTIATSLPSSILTSVLASILVENFFSIPGLGRLYTQAITAKDYNVVLAITSLMVVLVSISFILRDFLYKVFNPQMRRKGVK
ncbi:MAG: ABC transporter permease [Mycoplasmatales bacterium]|nr:ABC transporter permease [Mycoplasmatales bacterium]